MGMYINSVNGVPAPRHGKAVFLLLSVSGATKLPAAPNEWQENLVCVVDNGLFDAAAYAFDEAEMRAFLQPDSGAQRTRTWLIVPNAKEYAG